MVRRLLAVVALALVVSACGDGVGRDQALAVFEQVNPEIGGEQAQCVVDELIDRHGVDDLDALIERPEDDAQFEEDRFRALFRCGVEGDVTDLITDQLTAVGVATADAPCVAGLLTEDLTDDDIDVLVSGELTESFADKFADAAAECGLDLG